MADPITQIGITREAPFLEDYRRRLMDSAFKAGDKALMPLGRDISAFQPFQQAGFGLGAEQLGYTYDPATGGLTKTGAPSYDPFFQQAQAGLTGAQATGLLGIPALASAQAQYDPTTSNYQNFFNTYQADVTSEALKQMDQEAQKAKSNLATEAQRAGAFGGSRFGVREGELDKSLQDIKSRRIFQDLAQNFQQAQGNAMNTFEQARARNLGAAQGLGQLGMGLGQLAGQFGNLGAQQFGLGQQGLSSMMGIGQQQQTMEQAKADEALRLGTAKQQEPFGRIGWLQDMLSRTPSVQQTYGQQPIPYTNPLVGAVGAGMAGLGSFMGTT